MTEDLNAFIENLSDGFLRVLPGIVSAILILVVGFLIGRLVKRIVLRSIIYLNKRMNERLQIRMLNVDLNTSARFISSTFFWIIMVFAVVICIQVLQLNFLADSLDTIISYLPNILAAIIIIFAGIILGTLLSDLIQSAALRTGVVNGRFLGKVVRYIILFVAIVIAVDQVGIDIAFLSNLFIVILASLMVGASLAFALGARTAVSNILGSHYARKTHQLGTKIRIDSIEGTIVKITDHAISIETESGLMVIPAKDFNESKVLIIKDQSNEK